MIPLRSGGESASQDTNTEREVACSADTEGAADGTARRGMKTVENYHGKGRLTYLCPKNIEENT